MSEAPPPDPIQALPDASQRRVALALRDVLARLNSALPQGEVMDYAISRVCQLLGAEAGLIYRLERDGQVGHIQACAGLPPELCGFHYFPTFMGSLNRAIRRREHYVISDYRAHLQREAPDPAALPEAERVWLEALSRHYQAQLSFPLIVRDKLYGGLLLFYPLPRPFGGEDEQLGLILADLVALVIENARLQESTRQRADEFQSLLTVQQAITSPLDPDAVMQMIASEAQRLTGAQRAEVFLLDSSGERLVTTYISGNQPAEMVGRWLPVKESLAGQSLTKGEPLVFTDVDNDPLLSAEEKAGMLYKSQIGVPLLTASGPLGMIGVGHLEPGRLGAEQARVLTLLASSAAVALENARLYRAEQERRQEAERRRKVAEGLHEILGVLNSRRPFSDVLDTIVVQASQLLGASAGVIYHGFIDRERIVVEASTGAPRELLELSELPNAAEAVNRALMRREPYAVSDLDLAPTTDLPGGVSQLDPVLVRWKKVIRRHYRAYLAVPLIIKDDLYGALVLYYKERRSFTSEDVEVGMSLGRQVSLAIESAHLTAQTRQRAVELQSLFSVQQAIVSQVDPDAVLQMIADEARRLTLTEQGAVYLLDEEGLVVSVISGDVPKRMLGLRLPLEGSVAGEVVRTGQPVLVSDTAARPDVYHPVTDPIGARSFLIVPMLSGEKAIGTITVSNKSAGALGRDTERVLTLLASSAVIALENARLYRGEQERRREAERRRAVAEGLRDILAVLNSDRPLEDILKAIVAQACRLLGTDAGAIYRLYANEGLLRIQSAQGLPADYITGISIPYGQAVVGQAVAQRRPVAVADIKQRFPDSDAVMVDPQRRELIQSLFQRYRSLLAVPLTTPEETYGALILYYPIQRGEFSEEELNLAMAFADQAALAIQNARLILQVEETAAAAERNRLARDLHDAVTQTLFSASLIAEVLPRLWGRDPAEGHHRLDELRQLTRGALAEMRTLLMELRPSALMEVSLPDLLRQLAEAFNGRARTPVDVETGEIPDLPADVRLAFYRIAQEALNNISKHAQASRVQIRLRAARKRVSLTIRDDGQGFDLTDIPSDHLGLGIMRERAESIGAHLRLESRTGQGTSIEVSWPGG